MKKEPYTKRSPYWDQFLTVEEILKELNKRGGFVRQTARECHVEVKRIRGVIKATEVQA